MRHADRESYTAYTLFCAAFVADLSLASLYYPASMFCYALLSMAPSRRYWQVSGRARVWVGWGSSVCEASWGQRKALPVAES